MGGVVFREEGIHNLGGSSLGEKKGGQLGGKGRQMHEQKHSINSRIWDDSTYRRRLLFFLNAVHFHGIFEFIGKNYLKHHMVVIYVSVISNYHLIFCRVFLFFHFFQREFFFFFFSNLLIGFFLFCGRDGFLFFDT